MTLTRALSRRPVWVGNRTELDDVLFYDEELAIAKDEGTLYMASVPTGRAQLGSQAGTLVALIEGNVGTPDYVGATAGTDVIGIRVQGDTQRRLNFNADGSMEWGSGSATGDVTLSRSASGQLQLTGNGSSEATLRISDIAGTTRDIRFLTSGSNRWILRGADNTAEGGANAGSNFVLQSRDDAGAFLRTDVNITRSSGLWTVGGTIQPNVDNSVDLGGSSNAWRSIYWKTQALGPDGSIGSPTFAFASTTNTGIYSATTNAISFSLSGAERIRMAAGGAAQMTLGPTYGLAWGSAVSSPDVFLYRDGAANILALRNAANAQTFRVYNTFTDASNYERLSISAGAGGTTIFQEQLGTGTARSITLGTSGATSLIFRTSGSDRITIGSAGNMVSTTDNAVDLGSTGQRFRNIYWGTQSLAPDGSAGTPSRSFVSDGTTGIWYSSTGINFSAGGANSFRVLGSHARVGTGMSIGWGSGDAGTASDTMLRRASAGVVSQSNLANAQRFYVYNTTDSDSSPANYERGVSTWSGNQWFLVTEAAGTGTARDINVGTNGSATLKFMTNNSVRWTVGASTGHFLAQTDNSNDFGASGATRARSIYWGTQALGPDGSAGAPSFSFANETTIGMYRAGATDLRFSIASTDQLRILNGSIVMLSTQQLGWGSSGVVTPDVILFRDGAAGILALKNGANAQTIRVYGNTTGPVYLSLAHNGTNALITMTGGNQLAFASGAKGTTDTIGYVCIPSCAGAPTGVPANIPTGQIPMVIDSTNNFLYFYIGGAWKKSTVYA